MKILLLFFLALSSTFAFSLEKRQSHNLLERVKAAAGEDSLLNLEPDYNWPTDCPIPECEKIQRALKYPSPQKRFFYQCFHDGKRWIPQMIPCPCDLIFAYQTQNCVYPWDIQEWCSSDYVVDIRPVACDTFRE